MGWFLTKVTITALLAAGVSEAARRSSLLGAILASIPLVSVLGMTWLYVDTGDAVRVSSLARSIFWLVLPSLSLFLVLPVLLKQAFNFYAALTASLVVMVGCYLAMIFVLSRLGIRL